MLLCGVRSRHAMVAESATLGFHTAITDLCGTHEDAAAHPDSAYYFLRRLAPRHLIDLIAQLVQRLIRMRCLERFRFDGDYLVAVDATWLRTYKHRHCEHCLSQTHSDGTQSFHHAVVEAKLILAPGIDISMGSVSIENPGQDFDKQDCELKAFTRLAAQLKRLYPRLPICLLMDSLYGVEPVIKLCEENRWSYVIVLKEGRTPALYQRALEKARRSDGCTVTLADGTQQHFTWATNLQHNQCRLHAVFCTECKPDGTTRQWAWITDLRPNAQQAPAIANQAGRLRWQVEESFNLQKNGEIELRHDYGSKGKAWYNTYLIAQIASILMVLMSCGNQIKKLSGGRLNSFRDAYPTLRNFVARLRESIQRDRPGQPGRLPVLTHVTFDTS